MSTEEKFKEHQIENKIEELHIEEQYNNFNKEYIEILKSALQHQKKHIRKEGTAYFTKHTHQIEQKYTFFNILLRFKVKKKGSKEKVEKLRIKTKSSSDY